MPKSIDVIVGGQFGSEAKGHVTQQVIRRLKATASPNDSILNIRIAGPNAGHTVMAARPGYRMDRFAFRQLPVGIVEDAGWVDCAIAAGSEISIDVLMDEIYQVKAAGLWPTHRTLIVDPECTMIWPEDLDAEGVVGLTERIGSTGKGVGAARSQRLMRQAGRRVCDSPTALDLLRSAGVTIAPVAAFAETDCHVVIEGTQGFGLGLHAGYYPQCTSSDCRAIDFLAMAGVSPWSVALSQFRIWVTVRPYPIRVAGNSGPLLGETTWEALGLPEEKTTVTQKVRRVGLWDGDLVRAAVAANGGGATGPVARGGVALALTMADQIDPDVAGATDAVVLYESEKINAFVEMVQTQTGALVDLVTTSPSTAVWI